MDPATYDLSVAVFARNEASSIPACLTHVLAAGRGASLCIDVLLNGTSDRSAELAQQVLAGERQAEGRVWTIRHADKSNAINQFIERVRPPAETYVFVDAYARVHPDALRRLAAALATHQQANAAAAVPSSGRSAAAIRRGMLADPGIHGSLFALRGAFVDRLAASGFRLPVNLYRGDGLLASMAMHDLDAKGEPWTSRRVVVVPDATWAITPLSPWSLRDVRRQFLRQIRQRRGRLESAVIKALIYSCGTGYGSLGSNADAMLTGWVAEQPNQRRPRSWRDPLAAMAWHQARSAAPPAADDLLPAQVWPAP